MPRTRRTIETERAADNSDLTYTDLAVVVEALTGVTLDHSAPVTPDRTRHAALSAEYRALDFRRNQTR